MGVHILWEALTVTITIRSKAAEVAAVVATEADVVVMGAVAVVAPVSAVLVAEAGVQPCRQHSTDSSHSLP